MALFIDGEEKLLLDDHSSNASLSGVGAILKGSNSATSLNLPPSSSANDLQLASICERGIVEGTAVHATGVEATAGLPLAATGAGGEGNGAGCGGSSCSSASFFKLGDGSRELV